MTSRARETTSAKTEYRLCLEATVSRLRVKTRQDRRLSTMRHRSDLDGDVD